MPLPFVTRRRPSLSAVRPALALIAAVLAVTVTARGQSSPWPSPNWLEATPASVGLDAGRLEQARDYALSAGGSGMILRHGKAVLRWGDQRLRYDIKSATKSFGATMLGLAIKDGKVTLETRARQCHPTFGVPPPENGKTGWLDAITLRHLATQTAGFEKPGGYEPLLFAPGTQWHYSDGGPNWLAECLTLAYGRDLSEVMFERVFTPLGIGPDDLRWRNNSYRPHLIEGVARREFGAGILANVEALSRVGYLYLRQGRWQGQQILTEDFVRGATRPDPAVVDLPEWPGGTHGNASAQYGLLWWTNADGALASVPRDAYWAWGLYDSLIVVVPSLDLVVVRGGANGRQWPRDPAASHYQVLDPFLGPIVAAASGSSATGGQDAALRERARAGLRRAVEFFRSRVSTGGGYHFAYAEDLSYGRSEQSEGSARVEIQRDGTPIVALAYLDAYEATGDRYYLEAARDVALLLVKGQYCNGGWSYVIELEAARRASHPYRADGRCKTPDAGPERQATLDDNVTQAAARVLMRVDRDLGFKDAAIHEASRFALDSLIRAQYPNGAWPQRYTRFPDPAAFPVRKASYPATWPRTWPRASYYDHYTFNDNSIVDVIDLMLEAARIYDEPRYRAAAEKGGDFILLAQMPDPQPGWAQQYDRDMHPAWARQFEPASITGGESQAVMRALLLLYRETGHKRFLEPLPRALAYYQRSLLPPATTPSEARRRACPGQTPCAARFYELQTNRPLYITKGTRVTTLDQGAVIVGGYELSYSDASVITHYSVLVSGAGFAAIERELQQVQAAAPASLRRPDRLRGLSPWSESASANPNRAARPADARVRAILDGMDARGAWVEEGTIGRADRLVSVFAGRDLVVRLGGKTLPVSENDTLEVFLGPEPPRERIIRSRTFAEHVGALSAYVRP